MQGGDLWRCMLGVDNEMCAVVTQGVKELNNLEDSISAGHNKWRERKNVKPKKIHDIRHQESPNRTILMDFRPSDLSAINCDMQGLGHRA